MLIPCIPSVTSAVYHPHPSAVGSHASEVSLVFRAQPMACSLFVGCNEALSGAGADYRGCQTRTRSGNLCQQWDSQSPHGHSTTSSSYPTAGLVSNYCRNPDGESSIWCYTTDPDQRWEYCDPLPTGARRCSATVFLNLFLVFQSSTAPQCSPATELLGGLGHVGGMGWHSCIPKQKRCPGAHCENQCFEGGKDVSKEPGA